MHAFNIDINFMNTSYIALRSLYNTETISWCIMSCTCVNRSIIQQKIMSDIIRFQRAEGDCTWWSNRFNYQ